jgi:hypothetical protein
MLLDAGTSADEVGEQIRGLSWLRAAWRVQMRLTVLRRVSSDAVLTLVGIAAVSGCRILGAAEMTGDTCRHSWHEFHAVVQSLSCLFNNTGIQRLAEHGACRHSQTPRIHTPARPPCTRTCPDTVEHQDTLPKKICCSSTVQSTTRNAAATARAHTCHIMSRHRPRRCDKLCGAEDCTTLWCL